jgi:hypothetical protein
MIHRLPNKQVALQSSSLRKPFTASTRVAQCHVRLIQIWKGLRISSCRSWNLRSHELCSKRWGQKCAVQSAVPPAPCSKAHGMMFTLYCNPIYHMLRLLCIQGCPTRKLVPLVSSAPPWPSHSFSPYTLSSTIFPIYLSQVPPEHSLSSSTNNVSKRASSIPPSMLLSIPAWLPPAPLALLSKLSLPAPPAMPRLSCIEIPLAQTL